MNLVTKIIPAVLVAALFGGCASVPKVPEKSGFTLVASVPVDSNISIEDNRRKVVAETFGCGPVVEYNFSDFKTTPIDFLSRTIPAEVASIEPSGTTYNWLRNKSLSLLEFRAIGGKICAGSVDPIKSAPLAAVNPIGPLFGMLFDSLAEQAKRKAFVQWRVTIGIEGQEFISESMSTNFDVPPDKVFGPVAQSVTRSLAEKIIEHVRKNDLSK